MWADPNIVTPTISGDLSFTESTTVTMECTSPNSDIYYTTDGVTDPRCDCAAAPEYKQPITITETTIIKAAAYDGNDWSAVAEVTFTKVPASDPATTYTVTFTNLNNVVKVVENITLPHTFSCDYTNGNGELDLIIQESYNDTGHCDNSRSPWGGNDNEVVVGQDGNNHFVTINAPFVGTSFLSGYYDGINFGTFYYSFHITIEAASEPQVERELTKLGFNFPSENIPADNDIEMAGTFEEGTMWMEKIIATGWFVSYDFVNAAEDETFKLRSKSNNDLVLCQFIPANDGEGGKWVQAIFTFGNYWDDDTWNGTPCKLIEKDLSDAAQYAWMEGMPESLPEGIENIVLTEKAKKVVVDGMVYIVRDGKMFDLTGVQVR